MHDLPPRPLIAIATILLFALGYELLASPSAYSIPPARVAPLPKIPERGTSFMAPPLGQFSVISDRPLFDVRRKKYVPPRIDLTKPALQPPPNLFLVGVIIDAERRLAMVKFSENALASSVALGAEIGTWKVDAIEADRIVLKAGASEHEVRLEANKAPPQSAQPSTISQTVQQSEMRPPPVQPSRPQSLPATSDKTTP